MKNIWIKFGCFLCGFKYSIVNSCSEVTAKSVKRFTSALIIVCVIWAFVGYSFTQRYLEGNFWTSILGSLIAVVIIIQIERQIILSIKANWGLYIFRGLLALMMAILGAVIIDQIILKQDIELEKISYINSKVDSLLPSKTKELRAQIFSLDTTIQKKEAERQLYIEAVGANPLIKNVSTQTQTIPISSIEIDSSGNSTPIIIMKPSTTISVTNIANPKQSLIAPLDTVIRTMRSQMISKENELLNIRPELEKEIKEKTGFLDELKVMYVLISKSNVALCFWLLWFFFLLFIEMMVLFAKVGEKENDYTKTILHQMELQNRKLDILFKRAQE